MRPRTENGGQIVGAFEDAFKHLAVDTFDVLTRLHVFRVGEPIQRFLFIHQVACLSSKKPTDVKNDVPVAAASAWRCTNLRNGGLCRAGRKPAPEWSGDRTSWPSGGRRI